MPAPIESPCNGVCKIDERAGFCEGCGRTLDEIARWPDASDQWKREVIERLRKRR